MAAADGVGMAVANVLVSIGLPEQLAQSAGETVIGAAIFLGAFSLLYVAGKRLVMPVADRAMAARDLDPHARKPLEKVLWIGYLFIGITVAFGVAGYGNFLTSLATIAAAATLAVGFAMQEVLRNFVSGVFIFIEKPFRIGDWIEWDGNTGKVEDISLRITRVRTFDNELLTVPNSQLTDNVVKNPVDADTLRLKPVFGIGYDDDIDTATEIILDTAAEHDGILDDPAPNVRLTELGDSSIGLQARIWIPDPSRADFLKTRTEFIQTVKQRFDDAGIDIPYPHRTLTGDITVDNEPSS